MGDSDSDCPDLVDSSDDDIGIAKTNEDFAEVWLNKTEKFMEKQEHGIRIFSLGPFLFAINNVAPSPWGVALRQAGLLLNQNRERELTGLDWNEWAMVDLMEAVITAVQKNMRKKDCLKNVMDILDKVDTLTKGVSIDVNLALSEAGKHSTVTDVWAQVLRSSQFTGKEKQAKFGVLFVMKIYQLHVISTGRDNKDFVEEMKKKIKSEVNAESLREEGNVFHTHEKYDNAVTRYTQAAKADPFNHVYFGNRGQSYSKLFEFRNALSDGRRAITLKQDWYKGHYRYAQAFYKLNKLDMAIAVNKAGLEVCRKCKVDDNSLRDLVKQGKDFQREKEEIEDVSRAKHVISHVHGKFNDLPGNKKVINLADAWCCDDDEEEWEKPPPLVGSDDDLDTVPDSQHVLDHTANNNKGTKSKSGKRGKMNGTVTMVSTKTTEDKAPPKKQNSSTVPVRSVRGKENAEIMGLMREGTKALHDGLAKNALTSYQKALDMVSHNQLGCLGIDKEDLVTLKYAFGMAAVDKGLSKPIMEGIEKFWEIIHSHSDVKFPLAYFGLGKANVALNRYVEALEPLNNGLAIAQKVRFSPVCWPGSTVKIEESEPEKLKTLLKELLQLCRYPPTPDAVCRFHVDTEDSREVIYFADPDFKGFVRMLCQSQCLLELHEVCWRAYKHKLGGKISDKEVLDTPCPTPDCTAVVIKIIVFRSDTLHKELVSEKNPPKVSKPKSTKPKVVPSSTNKVLTKKQDRKQQSRQKLQDQEEADDLIEDVNKMLTSNKENEEPVRATAAVSEVAQEDIPLPKPASESLMMLKKEEDDAAAKYKVAKKQQKQKKKKEKVKHVLNVEVNFSDRKEETLLGEHSVNSDEEANAVGGTALDPQNPFSVPADLKDKIEAFESSYAAADPKRVQHDDVTENLFHFFADILQAHGPLHIWDPILAREVESFPEEAKVVVDKAGGLSEFLRQSLRFAMIEDIVCLLKDAVKARELALKRMGSSMMDDPFNPTLNPHASEFQPKDNPWKTVTKGVKHSSDNFSGLGTEYPTLQNTAGSDNIPVLQPESDLQETNKPDNAVVKDSMLDFRIVCKPKMTSNYKNPSELDSVNELPPLPHTTMDTLDSIDDEIPLSTVPKKKKKKSNSLELGSFTDFRPPSETDTDSLVDGGHLSDIDSIGSGRSEDKLPSKKFQKSNGQYGEDISMSRSSSKSDISEQSDISTEIYSKPGKPSAVVHPRTASPAQKLFPWLKKSAIVSNSSMKIGGETFKGLSNSQEDIQENSTFFNLKPSLREAGGLKLEQSDLAISRNQDNSSVSDNIYSDAKAATAEHIRNVDNEFVAELAESVVDQMFTGKSVNEVARNSALKQVSADIWKDFEHEYKMSGSDSMFGIPQQARSRYSWANSSSRDYGRTKGKFVEDFMKRHYKQPALENDKPSNPFSNLTSVSWSTNDDSEPHSNISQNFPSFSSNYSLPSETSNYNLFDGPSLGFTPVSPPGGGDYSSGFQASTTSSPLSLSQSLPPLQSTTVTSAPAPLPLPKTQPSPLSNLPNPIASPKAVARNSVSIQAVPVLVTVETNTEPYEPFREELVKANQQIELFTENLRSQTGQIQDMNIQLQSKEYKCKELELEVENKKSMFEMEKRNWDDERQSFTRELQRIKQQSSSKDTVENELKDKLSKLQKEISELLQKQGEERDKQIQDQSKALEMAEQFRKNHEVEQERAKNAEIKILKMRMQTALQIYERAQKEAGYHRHHLSGFLKKHVDENVTVPAQLSQVLAHWKTNMQKIEETILKLKHEFEDHMMKIQGGMKLSDLPPITVPPPPQAPDPIRPTLQPSAMPPLALMPPPMSNGTVQPGVFLKQVALNETSDAKEKTSNIMASTPTTAPLSQPAPLSTIAQIAKQKPLAQPVGAPGLAPPRPLIGTRPPFPVNQYPVAAIANRAPVRPLTPLQPSPRVASPPQPLKNSFEKLIMRLQMVFPKYSRTHFTKLIQDLRSSRGGSLSGMNLDDIIKQVTDMILTQEQVQLPALQMAPITLPTEMVGLTKPVAPPPGLNSSWGFQPTAADVNSLQSEVFHEEEDPCVICHEELARDSTITLECKHKFHDECIRKWLHEQSTCPNCRVHALLTDEFPAL